MAKEEIRETIGYVREAETQVTVALQQPGLADSQRDLLNDLAETLRDLDAQLVLEDLKSCVTAFKEKAEQMNSLNKETQEKLQDLQDVSETVGKVAKAVNGLVKALDILV